METKYLKEFVILTKTKNFLEAAESLHISQPLLSLHIKYMESELGVTLFNRTTRKVEISEFGQIFLPYAEQIVELHDSFKTELTYNLSIGQVTLTLGSISHMDVYKISNLLVDFSKIHPISSINVIQAGSDVIKGLLRKKECEIAFIQEEDENDCDLNKNRNTRIIDTDIVKIPFNSDTFAAILPKSHPLAKEKIIPLDQLSNEHFILFEKQTLIYRLSMAAFKKSGFVPKIANKEILYENMSDVVIQGKGIILMMKKIANHDLNPKVVAVDILPSMPTTVNLCYLTTTHLSNAAKEFVKFVKSQKFQ